MEVPDWWYTDVWSACEGDNSFCIYNKIINEGRRRRRKKLLAVSKQEWLVRGERLFPFSSLSSDPTLLHFPHLHKPPPSHTFTWETFFPRGIKLTGPVWFRKVGCQCSLQAHGEPWIMDLPPVWVPSWDSQLPPPLAPVVTGIVNVPLTANDS